MSSGQDDTGGLLARMARLVRPGEPASAAPAEAAYSPQDLKDIIERKRRNDRVRKREFEALRKLRRNGPQAVDELRPSFFQSSLPARDDRAGTLKKIDEIEAQMSQQWWKTHQGGLAAAAATPAGAPAADDKTVPLPLLTSVLPSTPDEVSVPPRPVAGPTVPGSVMPGPSTLPGVTGAGIEVTQYVHDPLIESLAMRFAQHDDAGVEAALREALGPLQPRADHLETWLTLLDFYQATEQRLAYERAVRDGAAQTGQVLPRWREPEVPAVVLPSSSSGFAATAPVGLPTLAGDIMGEPGAQLDALELAWRTTPGPLLRVDCRALVRMDFTAAGALLNRLMAWQADGRRVVLLDVHRLLAALFQAMGISRHAQLERSGEGGSDVV